MPIFQRPSWAEKFRNMGPASCIWMCQSEKIRTSRDAILSNQKILATGCTPEWGQGPRN